MTNTTANLCAFALGVMYIFVINTVSDSPLRVSARWLILAVLALALTLTALALAYYVDGFTTLWDSDGNERWGWMWWGRIVTKYLLLYAPLILYMGWRVLRNDE